MGVLCGAFWVDGVGWGLGGVTGSSGGWGFGRCLGRAYQKKDGNPLAASAPGGLGADGCQGLGGTNGFASAFLVILVAVLGHLGGTNGFASAFLVILVAMLGLCRVIWGHVGFLRVSVSSIGST